MFGFNKTFVLFLILSLILGLATKSFANAFVLLGIFVAVKFVWNILTE
jgi:hypothetical protein